MKATCISACEIAGIGIIDAGETVELHDGFFNDPRVRMHFSIEESTVKDRNAQPPDMMAQADARRERFAKHLCDHTARVRALNALRDFGADIPREIVETDSEDAPTEPERIAKIVELWCDNFGYDFPTDEKKQEKRGERGEKGEKPDKKPDKGKGKKGRPSEKEEAPEGERQDGGEGERQDDGSFDNPDGPTGPVGTPGDIGAFQQMNLFDKLNGRS